MANETIIIDIQVNADDVKAKLVGVTGQLSQMKAETKLLKDSLKEMEKAGGASAEELANLKLQIASNEQQMKTLTVTEKALQQQMNGLDASNSQLGDSFKEQEKLLNNLKLQYKSLSKEQQNTEGGKALKKQIDDLDKSVKANDASMGEFFKNVGNYPILGKFGDTVSQVGSIFSGGFTNGLKSAGQSVLQFGKILLTTPIGWIAAIVGVAVAAFMKLKEAFEKNDQASTRLSAAMAQLKPITEAISWIFDKLAIVVSKLVEGFMDAVTWVLKLIPAYNEAAKAAENLVLADDRLEESQRNATINEAWRNKEIAKLKKKSQDVLKYDAKQREKFLQQADDLEMKNMEEKKRIAKEELRILEQKAKEEVDTSDETANKIAAAKAKLLNIETEYFHGTIRIESRRVNAQKEILAEEQRIEEEAARKREEARRKRIEAKQKETDLIRQMEDKQFLLLKESAETQKKLIETTATREIADLNYKLATEENLTAGAKNAIRKTIKAIEDKKVKDLAAIDELAKSDQLKRDIAANEERLNLLLSDVKKGSLEELNLKLRLINSNREEELKAVGLTEQEIANIKEKYRQQENAAIEENETAIREKQRQAVLNDFEQRKNDLFGNEAALNALELEQKQAQYDALLAMDAETKAKQFANEEAYRAAVIAAEGEILTAKQKVQEQGVRDVENLKTQLDAISGGISDVLNAIAGDDAEMAKFVKAVAIAQASLNLGLAISKAVAAGAGNPIALATNVGAVLTAMAGVISSIKAVQTPKAKKFATGGVVKGIGSGDTVPAMLTPREMVLNQAQQARLFGIANGNNYSNGINYELLAGALSKSLKNMPAPVMDYKEFTTFENNLATVKEQITI